MGMDLVSEKFYIYVGTNIHINIFFQTIFWILILTFFLKKDDSEIKRTILPLFLIPIIFTFQLVSESRFYSYIHSLVLPRNGI